MNKRVHWFIVPALLLAACGGSDGDGSAGGSDWCALAQRLEDNDTAFEGLLGDDPDAVKDAIDELRGLLDEAARSAPDAILADVNTSADGVDALAKLIEDANYDITQIEPADLEELDVLGDEMNAATDRIEQYNETECGIVTDDDDDDDDDAGGDPSDDGDATASTEQATVEPDDDSDDDSDDGSDDDGGFAGDADSEWCAAARDVETASDALDAEDFDFADPASVERAFGTMLAAFERALASGVPPEIADDVETSYEGFVKLDEALAAVDYDFLSADLSLIDDLDAEMDQASARIEEYNEAVCGIPADADGSSDDGDDAFDPSAGSIRDQTIAELVSQGFTEAEAECIFDQIDFTDPDLGNDMNVIIGVFDACGIDLARLAELGG